MPGARAAAERASMRLVSRSTARVPPSVTSRSRVGPWAPGGSSPRRTIRRKPWSCYVGRRNLDDDPLHRCRFRRRTAARLRAADDRRGDLPALVALPSRSSWPCAGPRRTRGRRCASRSTSSAPSSRHSADVTEVPARPHPGGDGLAALLYCGAEAARPTLAAARRPATVKHDRGQGSGLVVGQRPRLQRDVK